jgi:signal transduction histidine kinase
VKPLPSMRRRLARTLLLVSAAWSVAVAAVVGLVVQHEISELFDASLQESAQVLHGLLSTQSLPVLLANGPVQPAAPHHEYIIWQVVDAQQQVLLRSHEAPATALVSARTSGFFDAGDEWRVHVAALESEALQTGLMLQVAQNNSERTEAYVKAGRYTTLSALTVSLLCALWLSLRLRRELQPIADLSEAVDRFDPLQPHARLPEARLLELQTMQRAVSDLGARLARRVTHERAFTAHAAHALRTPLAGMVAQLAAAQHATPDQIPAMLSLARQAADRLRRVVAALLTLFRSGADLRVQRVDLPELVAQLQVDGLAICAQRSAPLLADPDLLAAALANLLDNAVRHGATKVEIALHDSGGSPCIVLADNGPGIPEAERKRLQAALGAQHYEGSTGLGLMLADLVARAHGGWLRLPAGSAQGCTVELLLGPLPASSTAG